MELVKEAPKTIDQAISACDELIANRKQAAQFILMAIYTITTAFFFLLISYFYYYYFYILKSFPVESKTAEVGISPAVIYAGVGLYVLVFGVMMSVYRFHLVEGAKAEHAKLGFLRVRIAANNTSVGFMSEVREALTRGAFDYQLSGSLLTKKAKIDSPLPGHPTMDLTTAVINKLLEQIEINIKKK